MAKKTAEHIIMRNGGIFCSHCGRSQDLPKTMEIDVFGAIGRAFTKTHKDCVKTWVQPEADQAKTEAYKAQWWLSNGERGISSETMFSVISNTYRPRWTGHPCDPDDFRRCYLLLKAIPEWRAKMDLMRPLSKAWSNLVDSWDKLTEMLEEMMVQKKDNGMYDLMQKCIEDKL